MVTLTIDGIQVEVQDGTTVLNAAKGAGVKIPRLCYHSTLKPYGGCRLCMVEVEGARILQPSCTLPVTNNMVVHTNTPKVQGARKFVLSMIFSERNHFCMYCQATDGDCELQCAAYQQNMTHWPLTPNYSPFTVDASHKYFVLDNNRCILCRRCVRACADLVGNFTLGFEERGASSVLVADYGLPIGESSCISCGTCVQICPTGALIDRKSAYQGRETDVNHCASVCTDCSLGCQRDILTRDNRLVRIEGVWDAPMNRGLLCEKGRYTPLEAPVERFYTPLILKDGKHKAATWDEALTLISENLKNVGGKSVAALVSPRMPIETLSLFKNTFRTGFRADHVYLTDQDEAAETSYLLAGKLHGPFESKLETLKHTDVALILDEDLEEDHQVAGFFLKRQMLEETKLITVDDADNKLFHRSVVKIKQTKGTPLDFVLGFISTWHTLIHENDKLAEDIVAALPEKTGIETNQILKAVKLVENATNPVIVIGSKIASSQNYDAFERLVLFAKQIHAAVVVIKGKANSLAAAQIVLRTDFDPDGKKAAFVALGDEKPSEILLQQCENIPFLAVFATHPSLLTEKADVILPAANWAEEGGHFLSSDGRLQEKVKAIEAPEGIWDSLKTIQALASSVGISCEDDWQEALTAQPASVELEL
ncbi:MAG: 2Fe-2S iron-sulfur cluster-binding protein [Anaerolineaceae bacterium]